MDAASNAPGNAPEYPPKRALVPTVAWHIPTLFRVLYQGWLYPDANKKASTGEAFLGNEFPFTSDCGFLSARLKSQAHQAQPQNRQG